MSYARIAERKRKIEIKRKRERWKKIAHLPSANFEIRISERTVIRPFIIRVNYSFTHDAKPVGIIRLFS